MTSHAPPELIMQDVGITEGDFQYFIDNIEPTSAGVLGFNVTRIPVTEPQLVDNGILHVTPAPMILGGIGVKNVETVREYEAFGVKLNDTDDIISVSIVLAVVAIIYIGKSSIDYWFAAKLELFKKKLDKK
tara:strand:+ start:40 stop:432 length:393 start_codon:yes stop_codon:yes gene_type:complete